VTETPRYELIANEALDELPDSFTAPDAREWFAQRYPERDYKLTSMNVLRQMSVNEPWQEGQQWSPLVKAFRVLFRIDRSHYRRYVPTRDGLWENGTQLFSRNVDGAL
jgi:hypothetical protein